MATQVESVVTTMNVTHLDFDIESSEETNSTDFTRTAQALALVRSWASSTGRTLNISYTLPVLPSGFTSDGLNVLNAAQSSGFKPDVVNIMTMDYGTSGTEMGTASNQALDAAAGQVASVFGESTSAAYAMLGNTPMIGQNDSPGEIFSLADTSTVESHAASEGIALVSFWAEGRDNGGCPGQTSASSTCSGLSQGTGAFTQAFQAFTSGSTSGGGGTGPTPPPTTPPPTSPPTAHLPPAHQRLVRRGLEQLDRLHVRQRGLLQRPQLDRQPVELRRGTRRGLRRLERRRRLLTSWPSRGCGRGPSVGPRPKPASHGLFETKSVIRTLGAWSPMRDAVGGMVVALVLRTEMDC